MPLQADNTDLTVLFFLTSFMFTITVGLIITGHIDIKDIDLVNETDMLTNYY
jgi:hypothetical protein